MDKQLKELRLLSITTALLSGTAFVTMLRLAAFPTPGSAELYAFTLFGVFLIVVPHMAVHSKIKKVRRTYGAERN